MKEGEHRIEFIDVKGKTAEEIAELVKRKFVEFLLDEGMPIPEELLKYLT